MSRKEEIEVIRGATKEYIDNNMKELLKNWGSNIRFEDDVWFCDIASDFPHFDYTKRITFSNINENYKEFVKYYVILCDQRLSTVQTNIVKLNNFFKYLTINEKCIQLKKVNANLIQRYRNYIESRELSKSTKSKLISCISDFFKRLNGWEGMPKNNPVNKRYHYVKRSKEDNKVKTRYIPDNITNQLNQIFLSEEIPIHYRLYYWLCVLYPTRGIDLLKMRIDSIKPFGNKYVYFKSEDKSRNTYGDTNLMQVYINYTDMGKVLVDLFYEQREVAISLQGEVKDEFKGLLFLYRPINRGYIYTKPSLLDRTKFNRFLAKICIEKGIDIKTLGEKNITAHRLRHNAITDRLYDNFSTTAIKNLSGQIYDSTIYDSYFYRREDKGEIIQSKNLKKRFVVNEKGIIEKTKSKDIKESKVDKKDNLPTSKVMFRGRIMNLDGEREKRLLANKRAYQVSHDNKCIGICTDIYSCNSQLFNCLGCDNFAPDLEEIEYFEHEIEFWKEKEEYFKIKGHVFQYEKSKQVRSLFETITIKLRKMKDNIGG